MRGMSGARGMRGIMKRMIGMRSRRGMRVRGVQESYEV